MKKENILIVDDDSIFREMVYEMVKTLGYDCTLAKDGIEALKLLRDERFSLLITDILMPEMDGIELIKEVKKILPNLWIIAMTGYAVEYPYVKIIESGASDYINKPFTFKELEIKLFRVIREKELINELTVLNRINILFASSNRIENIFGEALNIFKDGFGYLSCTIYLKEEKAEIFEYKNILKAHRRLLSEKSIRIEKNNRISLISKDAEFLFISDVTGDKEYLKNNELAKSAVLVPIKIGDEVVALLNVESKSLNGFNEQDIERIKSFANQISIALENFFLQLQTHQERDKFLDLYNNAPFGYHSLDLKGMFLDINDTELGWLGYSREELIGEKHFFEIATPESYKKFSRSLQKLIKSGYIHDIELELIRKDNTTFPVLLNARALYDRKGNFIKSRASILDITQRKLAEHEINGIRNILETTQNNLDIGLCTLDLDLCVMQLNSWMKKNYPRIEVGKVCYTSFGDRKEPCPWCPVIKCFKSGKTERSDTVIESLKGRQYLNFIASPIRDKKGEIVGAVETIIDVTEQKKAEERIEFLANTITESSEAIVGVDLEGNITLFNRGAQELTGFMLEEVIGKSIIKLNPETMEQIKITLKKGECIGKETSFISKKRKKISVIFSTFLIKDKKGSPKEIVGFAEDITIRKKMEENLREEKIRAEKLSSQLEFAYQELREIQSQMIKEETMVTTGELATGIAHEIKNPLGIIHASAQFCLDTFLLPKDLRKHLKTILRNAVNANKVIKDLLEFAKPADIELKPGEISKILDKTCALLRAKCLQQRIHVVKRISKYLPKIMLDEKHLEGAFLNIILNSIEAMPDGGTLKITGNLNRDRKYVIVTFSDTGCGIDPENIKHIFTPFYTTKRGGVGLGLSIARRIVDIHKGKIYIKSKLGSGTKVTIKFPVINN